MSSDNERMNEGMNFLLNHSLKLFTSLKDMVISPIKQIGYVDGWMDGGWEEQVISLDAGLSFILPMSKPFSYNLTRFFTFNILWTQFKNRF